MIQRTLPSACALLGFGAALLLIPASSHAEVLRLGEGVVPVEQVVELRLDPALPIYEGRVQVRLEVRNETSTFRFHAESMEILSIELERSGTPVNAVWAMLDGATVEVTTQGPLSPGELGLDVVFRDDFNTDAVSLYRMETGGRGYLFSQFEADDAREAFPCWDEPGFKIPYQLTLTIPAGDTAVSNTEIVSETLIESVRPMKRIEFAKTPPLPSYLLAIAVGAFDSYEVRGLGVPGRIYTVTGQAELAKTAADETPRILHALEDWFGRPYPYSKLDFIAVPDFWPGAMEHPGAITFADRLLLQDPRAMSSRARSGMLFTITHELAHQWFGNLVTMEWWDDLWLNESFADWMAGRTMTRLYPELRPDIAVVGGEQGIMASDARPSVEPIQRKVEDTGSLLQGIGIAYNKGKAVLRMFEGWAGEEEFRLGVLDYLDAHAWGNANSGDLWTALARRSSALLPQAMATFVEQPGFPLIEVESLDQNRIRITQRRFRNEGAEVEPQLWIVPMRLRYPGPGGVAVTQTVLLEGESLIVDAVPGSRVSWIVPKADAVGYYRWSLPDSLLHNLLDPAGSAAGSLSATERLDLIENATALLQSGHTAGPLYLETLQNLAHDPEPAVLTTLISKLSLVREQLVADPFSPAFAQYVVSLCRPALDRIGFEPTEGEESSVQTLRPILLEWIGRVGRDPSARSWADRSTRAYLSDSESVHASLVSAALSITAWDGDQALFDSLRDAFESAQRPSDRGIFLSALGGFGNGAIQRQALDYSLTDAVRASEVLSIVRGIRQDEDGRSFFLDWFEEHYPEYTGKIPPIYHPLLPELASGCSMARFDRVEEFLNRTENFKSGTGPAFAQVRDQIQDCVRLRDRESQAVTTWLHGNVRATAVTSPSGRSQGAQ